MEDNVIKTNPNITILLTPLQMKIAEMEQKVIQLQYNESWIKSTIRMIWIIVYTVFKAVVINSEKDPDKLKKILDEIETTNNKVMGV